MSEALTLSLTALQPAGPVNGSFASVFLLKDRPFPGQAAYDGKRVPVANGHNDPTNQQLGSHADKNGSPAIELQEV